MVLNHRKCSNINHPNVMKIALEKHPLQAIGEGVFGRKTVICSQIKIPKMLSQSEEFFPEAGE